MVKSQNGEVPECVDLFIYTAKYQVYLGSIEKKDFVILILNIDM